MFTFLFRMCVRGFMIGLVSILAMAAHIMTALHFPGVFRTLKGGAEYLIEVVGYLAWINPAYLNIASELGLATKLVLILYVIIIYIVLNGLWRTCTNTVTKATHAVRRPKNKEK